MICGICGEDTYISRFTFGSHRGKQERLKPQEVFIRDAYNLNHHKIEMHPDELQASRARGKEVKQTKAARKSQIYNRRFEVGQALSQDVVDGFFVSMAGHRATEYSDTIRSTSRTHRLGEYNIGGYATSSRRYRYPEPEAWAAYRGVQEQIERLEAEAVGFFTQAFEGGVVVPLGDWQAVQDRMDQAGQELVDQYAAIDAGAQAVKS